MKEDIVLMEQDANFDMMNENLKILIFRIFIYNYFYSNISGCSKAKDIISKKILL